MDYHINVYVTTKCSFNCSHCFICDEARQKDQTMTEEQFDLVCRRLGEFTRTKWFKSFGYDRVQLHILGGEPGLLGYDFYKKVLSKKSEYEAEYGLPFVFVFSSSLFVEDAVRISELFDKTVTSYDGPARFKTQARLDLWEKHCRELLAKRPGELEVEITLTKYTAGLGVKPTLDYLMDLGFKDIQYSRCVVCGNAEENRDEAILSESDASEFLIELADEFFLRREKFPDLMISPVFSVLDAFRLEKPCKDFICEKFYYTANFGPDGTFCMCDADHFQFIVDGKEMPSYEHLSVEEFLNLKSTRKDRRMVYSPQTQECRDCEFYYLCRGGCRPTIENEEQKPKCKGFRKFFKYIKDGLDSGKYACYDPKE